MKKKAATKKKVVRKAAIRKAATRKVAVRSAFSNAEVKLTAEIVELLRCQFLYIKPVRLRPFLCMPRCTHTIAIETSLAPDGSVWLVANNAHQHALRGGSGKSPESICWHNTTQYDASVTFLVADWPFASGYTVILVPAGATAGPFTVYSGTSLGSHDYKIGGQPSAESKPPGVPEVIID